MRKRKEHVAALLAREAGCERISEDEVWAEQFGKQDAKNPLQDA